jgi:gamma-glutamylcyclotransferase (GGCT)/AIG2-like uncharacterized protein YtfP
MRERGIKPVHNNDMTTNTIKLFVYGSLRSGFQSEAYRYMSNDFRLLGDAKVNGQLFDLGSYPAAKPAPGSDQYIVGELYELKDEKAYSWVFGQLDDYEGVVVEEGETALYRREPVIVYTGTGTEQAWIYWYNGDVSGKPVVPSGDIIEYLRNKK